MRTAGDGDNALTQEVYTQPARTTHLIWTKDLMSMCWPISWLEGTALKRCKVPKSAYEFLQHLAWPLKSKAGAIASFEHEMFDGSNLAFMAIK